jgi:hypothetical protein
MSPGMYSIIHLLEIMRLSAFQSPLSYPSSYCRRNRFLSLADLQILYRYVLLILYTVPDPDVAKKICWDAISETYDAAVCKKLRTVLYKAVLYQFWLS